MQRIKAPRRLRGMQDFPEEPPRRLLVPKPVEALEETLDLSDPLVNEIWGRMGKQPQDYSTAQRVATLKHKKYKTYEGTIPELITLDWLEQKKIPHHFQAFVYGGRNRAGGVVPDFLVWPGGRGIAWFVDTLYWHSKPEIAASDAVDRQLILGGFFEGIRIETVVALWETRIYTDRPAVFDAAMNGIELGQ